LLHELHIAPSSSIQTHFCLTPEPTLEDHSAKAVSTEPNTSLLFESQPLKSPEAASENINCTITPQNRTLSPGSSLEQALSHTNTITTYVTQHHEHTTPHSYKTPLSQNSPHRIHISYTSDSYHTTTADHSTTDTHYSRNHTVHLTAHQTTHYHNHTAPLAVHHTTHYHCFLCSSMLTPPGPMDTSISRPPITDMVWKKSYLMKSLVGLYEGMVQKELT